MATPKDKDENEDIFKIKGNTAANIEKAIDLQFKQLQLAKLLNIEGTILNEIKAQQIPKEKMIQDLGSSVVDKLKKIVKLQEKISKQGMAGATDKQMKDLALYLRQLEKAKNLRLLLSKQEVTLDAVLQKHGKGFLLETKSMIEDFGTRGAIKMAIFASFIAMAIRLFNIFQEIDKSAAVFRKTMGITRVDSEALEKSTRNITYHLAHVGVSAEEVYKSMQAVVASMGSTQAITEQMSSDIALFNVQLGVAHATSADFLKTMGELGSSTMDAQSNVALFTAKLSAAGGTNLSEVMGDVSAAAKSSYQYLSKNPIALAKAAIEARRMGTSLQSATQSSFSLLNFTDSVNKEMEASVLVGKSFNLQKARELAYNRDIKGLNNEILRLAKDVNFNQLDPFQQHAVAQALGKSEEEIGKMLLAEKQMRQIESSRDPLVQKQLAAYKQLANANKSIVDSQAKSLRNESQSRSNAEALKTISLAFNAILQKGIMPAVVLIAKGILFVSNVMNKISDALGPMGIYLFGFLDAIDDFVLLGLAVIIPKILITIGKGLKFFAKHPIESFQNIIKLIRDIPSTLRRTASGVKNTFQSIPKLFDNMIKPIKFVFSLLKSGLGIIVKYIPFVGKIAASAFGKVYSITGKIATVFGKVVSLIKPIAGVGAFFGKWLNPIGWIITAVIFLVSLFKRLHGIGDAFKEGILNGIWFGIKAIGGALYDTLLGPFVSIYKWIKKHFMGESPSEIGLGILNGIKAVSDMLIDALLSPYIKAWNLIKKIPFISKMFDSSKNIGASAIPDSTPVMNVEKASPKVDVKKTSDVVSTSVGSMNDEVTKMLQSVIDAINRLRDDMKNGSLTANVYIDSQKLDSLMGRRLAYTGQLS